MKKLVLLCLSLTLPHISADAQSFYDMDTLQTLELTFSMSNWADRLQALNDARSDERIPARATVNGVPFDSAGVKYKGNSSVRVPGVKKPFNIELDTYDNNDYQGYERIKLSNGFKDPSFVRETLAYEIARKCMAASRSNYATLTVNGEPIGLYTNTEAVDGLFAESRFGADDLPRFKCNPVSGWNPGSRGRSSLEYLGEDSTLYYGSYELKSDRGWKELLTLIRTLDQDPDHLADVLDVDGALWMLAFDNLMVNLDSYIGGSTQNYYLIMGTDGRFRTVVWDLNESFGGFTQLESRGLSADEMIRLDPLYGKSVPSKPLLHTMLNNPTWEKMYLAHYRTLLDSCIANGWYETRARELQAFLAPQVREDVNKLYPDDAFENSLSSSWISGSGPMVQQIVGITELMSARADYLTGHKAFQTEPPRIESVTLSPASLNPGSRLTVRAAVTNAETVLLAWRTNPLHTFETTPMAQDDSGDWIFETTLSAGTFDYTLYAENQEAGVFEPAMAGRRHGSIQTSGTVVINELLASNQSGMRDASGDFDDWIELLNTSDQTVSLNGYTLTDNPETPREWIFPDITLDPGQYLIVWADGDTVEDGLHASFKLSADGESLHLFDAEGSLVDEIVFPGQIPDVSYGRLPDGEGPFSEMTPTFGSQNRSVISRIAEASTDQQPGNYILEPNYPNPFNAQTILGFRIPSSGPVRLDIYNIRGRHIETLVNGTVPAGSHTVEWDAGPWPSGVYTAVLTGPGFREVRKMLLAR